MVNNNLVKNLNDQQLQAVIYNEGPSIIIAGAGVGKTRVLTHKIAYLIAALKIPSEKILALTFTNKAAKEMQARTQQLLNDPDAKVKVATYHSLCAQILRRDIGILNFKNNFNIIDPSDQKQILKEIYSRDFDTKADAGELRLLISYISEWKNAHLTKDDVISDYYHQKDWTLRAKVYQQYQEYLKTNSCLDFDDLLLLVAKLFNEFPDILSKWQNQFQFVLVDEFQDTNDLQYQILINLVKKHQNLTVVGDPDQTIYTWRGANINLILKFTERFPTAKTFILNQNYRSTTKILTTANSLIAQNQQRIEKNLFTSNSLGEDIHIFHAWNPNQEGNWVANVIKKLVLQENIKLNQIAVLYRNNYLSKDLEQAFINHNLNYKIIGGFKFFDRKEIKDILAYLKVIAWNDNLSTIRILNSTPKIGAKTIETFLEKANENNLTLSEYLYLFQHNLTKNHKVILQPLINSIAEIKKDRVQQLTSVYKLVEEILQVTNYIQKLKDNYEIERIDNIKQFLGHLIEFDKRNNQEVVGEDLLTSFLQEVSLYTDLEEENSLDAVNFMTIHSAKGLEFFVVFVIGVNEGILPGLNKTNDLTKQEKDKLEEEIRLFYVAITRAKKLLFLSSTNGFSYILNKQLYPSRFFQELDPQYLRIINLSHNTEEKFYPKNYKFNQMTTKSNNLVLKQPKQTPNAWQVNDLLVHDIFGRGVVTKIIGNKIQVAFHNSSGGIKILDANHKAIKKIN
ncbi:MAG: 3'-5' exonuclease [Spiroplasma sp.]|nr:3'-5' exonuclease [Spiroplasma sp.]